MRYKKTRAQAFLSGDKFYHTGEPCVRGHICKRWTVNWSCTECKLITQNTWAEKHRKVIRRKKKEMYEKNPRKYINKTLKWQRENPNKALKKQRDWRKRNWLRVIAWNANRRALHGGARYYGLTHKFIGLLIDQQRGKCVYCCIDLSRGFHIDHKKPLAHGGTNHRGNIQILCATCNLSKATKTHNEFVKFKMGEIPQ